ncbi:MAG: hypothetical protein IT555_19000 [Acetobacteraceae bacterium]|nr:hypothetical protein [Acetobacteraceae bacterium]
MRADMAKVIVERPRRVEGITRRGRVPPVDHLPAQEGMRARHVRHFGGKALNENLQPLRRFLAKQVGRPWNRIYAEISAHLRPTSAVQQHVRDHLHDFVAITPRRLANQMRQRPGDDLWFQPFYVHPRTGLLCRTDRLRKAKTSGRK